MGEDGVSAPSSSFDKAQKRSSFFEPVSNVG